MRLFAYRIMNPRMQNAEFYEQQSFIEWAFKHDIEKYAFALLDDICDVPVFGDVDEILKIWSRLNETDKQKNE